MARITKPDAHGSIRTALRTGAVDQHEAGGMMKGGGRAGARDMTSELAQHATTARGANARHSAGLRKAASGPPGGAKPLPVQPGDPGANTPDQTARQNIAPKYTDYGPKTQKQYP